MLVLERILSITDLDPDHIQMGISGKEHAALLERGGIRKDGIKAKASVLKKSFVKGDKPLPENTPITPDVAKKIKGAIAGQAKGGKVVKGVKPSDRAKDADALGRLDRLVQLGKEGKVSEKPIKQRKEVPAPKLIETRELTRQGYIPVSGLVSSKAKALQEIDNDVTSPYALGKSGKQWRLYVKAKDEIPVSAIKNTSLEDIDKQIKSVGRKLFKLNNDKGGDSAINSKEKNSLQKELEKLRRTSDLVGLKHLF